MRIGAIVNPLKSRKFNETYEHLKKMEEILADLRLLKEEAKKYDDAVLDQLIIDVIVEVGFEWAMDKRMCEQCCIYRRNGFSF